MKKNYIEKGLQIFKRFSLGISSITCSTGDVKRSFISAPQSVSIVAMTRSDVVIKGRPSTIQHTISYDGNIILFFIIRLPKYN